MIIGWHIVMCAYGFWLPNDSRGSGSYVENNPIKDGLSPQKWSFVIPFNAKPRGASTSG